MKHTIQSASVISLKLLTTALFVALATSGCGSSSKGDGTPDVVVDDSLPLGVPVRGVFNDGSIPTQLSFNIMEDSVLDGLFSAPGEDASSEFSIVSLPDYGNLVLRSGGQVFHYEPEPNYFGSDQFVYATAEGVQITVMIEVTAVPDAPELDKQLPLVANQGKLYSVILEGSDADGDSLSFSVDNLPDWLMFDPDIGGLSGVPRQSDVGMSPVMVLAVSDGTGLSDVLDDFQLEIVDINDPPSLNIAQVPRLLYGGEEFAFNVFPDDRDNDSVTVSVEPHAAFDASVVGDRITLRMRDINLAGSSQITIVGRDDRGAVKKEIVPVSMYPRTASGKGTTISGAKRGRGVHIVILGDGYASDQQEAFERHVWGVLDHIREDEGIAGHLGAFNIHMINTVSQQSGSDDSDLKDTVDTAFDSAYNCRSIERLVCADTLKLYEAALPEYPDAEQIILLVNDIRFGGSGSSGGRVAVTSAFHPEIALHEMGHSLADLADEYVDQRLVEASGAPLFEEGRFSNVSLLNDPELVPWAHWIDPSIELPEFANDRGVGIFEGGFYRSSAVYRGTLNSRMREYHQPFGPVNTEQWILRLYTDTGGYRELAPANNLLSATSGETLDFSVIPMFGPDVQQLSWSLNGEILSTPDGILPLPGQGTPDDALNNSIRLQDRDVQLQGGGALEAVTNASFSSLGLVLPAGSHELTLTLSDISGRIQVRPPHVGIFEKNWRIDVQ